MPGGERKAMVGPVLEAVCNDVGSFVSFTLDMNQSATQGTARGQGMQRLCGLIEDPRGTGLKWTWMAHTAQDKGERIR